MTSPQCLTLHLAHYNASISIKKKEKKKNTGRKEGKQQEGREVGLRIKKHEMKPRPPDCPGLCKQWERLFILPECINSFT